MEEWKPISGFEVYEVSNEGRVRRGERVLRPKNSKRGYLHLDLCIGGVKHDRDIHRLVAEAFLPNPDNMKEVDHINRDKTDNRLENLRWCTRSENCMNRETKPGKTGINNIWDDRGRFRVCIKNSKQKVSRCFSTLEEAIEYRNEVLA